MLAARENRLARDALLRRRLAAVDLPQGDDGRRARRLGGDHRLAWVAPWAGGIVEDLSPLVVGRDPRPVEAIYWDLYRATRQSPARSSRRRSRASRTRSSTSRRGARRSGLRALRRADPRGDPDVLVALRDDASARLRGHGNAEARVVRRRRGARARGRRAGLRGVQDERRRSRRRAKGAHAGVQRGRRDTSCRGDRGRARPAAGGVPRRHGNRGAADRRPELQPRARGLRPRRQGARAVRPALARGRSLRLRGARARQARRADADLLGREPVRKPRLQASSRGRRDGRRLGRRHLERVPPGEEDRRPRGDVRGQLRAAQLLQRTSRRSSARSGVRRSRTRGSSSTTSTTSRGGTSSSTALPEISAGELRIPTARAGGSS